MGVYAHSKFEVHRIIVTGFRQGLILTPLPQPQNEPLKSPPRLGLGLPNTNWGFIWNTKYYIIENHKMMLLNKRICC